MKNPIDKLILTGCKFKCLIGCAPYEQITPQLIILDLELFFDTRPAARTDNLAATVDYGAVHAVIKKLIAEMHYQLIETLASKIAEQLLKNFPLQKVLVRLKKPGPLKRLGGDWAGVEIIRP